MSQKLVLQVSLKFAQLVSYFYDHDMHLSCLYEL